MKTQDFILITIGNSTIIRNLNIARLIMTLRLTGALSDVIRICDLIFSVTFNPVVLFK